MNITGCAVRCPKCDKLRAIPREMADVLERPGSEKFFCTTVKRKCTDAE
jgi:hypothetical protein